MTTTCPTCRSEDVRKLSELWDEFGSGPHAQVARVEAAISAQLAGDGAALGDPQETVRAFVIRELAPPEKKYDLPVRGSCLQMSFGILMIVAGLVMVVVATLRLAATPLGPHQILIIVLGGLAIAVLGYTVGRIGLPKPTYRQYAERLVAWQRTFRCMQCGNHFAVDPEA